MASGFAQRQGPHEAKEAELAKLALERGGHDPAPAVVSTAYSLMGRMMASSRGRCRRSLNLQLDQLLQVL